MQGKYEHPAVTGNLQVLVSMANSVPGSHGPASIYQSELRSGTANTSQP